MSLHFPDFGNFVGQDRYGLFIYELPVGGFDDHMNHEMVSAASNTAHSNSVSNAGCPGASRVTSATTKSLSASSEAGRLAIQSSSAFSS